MTGSPTTDGFIGQRLPGGVGLPQDAEAAVYWFIRAVAEAVVPLLPADFRSTHQEEDHWMDSAEAADYLGMSKNALHKLTSAREVPFEQERKGCKLWFRRSDLDAWRRGQGGVDR
jgi:excisionase family DNA binding protein